MRDSLALQLKRPVVLVSSVQGAMRVYGDLLGFRENYRMERETDTFSHQLFGLPPELETTFVTLDCGDAERSLALIAIGEALAKRGNSRSAIVVEVASVVGTINEAQALGLRCLPIKKETEPTQGPPRSESGFYDHDGNPIVVYDLCP